FVNRVAVLFLFGDRSVAGDLALFRVRHRLILGPGVILLLRNRPVFDNLPLHVGGDGNLTQVGEGFRFRNGLIANDLNGPILEFGPVASHRWWDVLNRLTAGGVGRNHGATGHAGRSRVSPSVRPRFAWGQPRQHAERQYSQDTVHVGLLGAVV